MKSLFAKPALILGIMLCIAPLQAKKNRYVTLKPALFKAQMEQTANPCVIDVRSSAVDFEAGHIVGAIHLDPNSIVFISELKQLHPNQEAAIFVYCKMGKSSKTAAGKMASGGYKNVYSLKGGILAWKKNFPIVTP